MLKVTHLIEDLLEVKLMRQVLVLLEFVQEELDQGANHGPDLVDKLEELLRGVLVRLRQLGLVEELLEDSLLWVLR